MGERRRRTEGRGPMLALAGVLLVLGVAEAAREMTDTEPGGNVFSNLGYAIAEAVLEVYIVAGGFGRGRAVLPVVLPAR
ncbi:MAG: hypothetical protein M3334_07465 [Actinomycetota bacterium]|nr:hypothetical protein [Actinomycetota bacterium]